MTSLLWSVCWHSVFTCRDLQRLGELQTELAGSADFCATYLRCQLLLTKVTTHVTPLDKCQYSNSTWTFDRVYSLLDSVYSQALQEKLWTMAVPLCLKQNAKVSTAARQVSVNHSAELSLIICFSCSLRVLHLNIRSWMRRINWSSCTADWRRNRSPQSTMFVCRRKRYSSSSRPDPNEGQRFVTNTFEHLKEVRLIFSLSSQQGWSCSWCLWEILTRRGVVSKVINALGEAVL